jgi:Tfp pilus assembly protein PilF
MNYAMLAENMGDRNPVWYDKAEEWYREALKREPEAADLCYNYARFRIRTGRPCEAAVAAMLRAAPNWSQAWHLAGRAAYRDRDFRRALECFYRAMELAENEESRAANLNNLRNVEYELRKSP